jgi:hypothetical protein
MKRFLNLRLSTVPILTLMSMAAACAEGVAKSPLAPYDLFDPDQSNSTGDPLDDADASADGANGGENDGGDDGNGPSNGGGAGDDASGDDNSAPGDDDDASAPGAGADGDEGPADEPDAGADEPDASVPTDAPTGDACIGNTTCASAASLGGLSGDVSGPALTVTGTKGAFYKVQVREDDHETYWEPLPVGRRLRVSATLTGGAADYDLFLYADGSASCSAASDRSETSGNEYVEAVWDDERIIDSGRTVIIEVRYKSGACPDSEPYTLTITGN